MRQYSRWDYFWDMFTKLFLVCLSLAFVGDLIFKGLGLFYLYAYIAGLIVISIISAVYALYKVHQRNKTKILPMT